MDTCPYRLRAIIFILLGFAIAGPHAASTALAADLEYTLELPAADVSVERLAAGERARVADRRYCATSDAGLPEIPYRIVSLLVPPGSTVEDFSCDVSAPGVLRAGVNPLLVPEAISADGSRGDGPAVTAWSGGAFPAAPAAYLGTGYLHGHAIASFALYPVRITDGALTVSERMTLRVRTVPGEPAMTVVSRMRYNEQRDREVRDRIGALVENPEAMGAYAFNTTRVENKLKGFRPTSFPSLEGSPVDYVIVTNDSLADEFQTLADWKTAKGVPTVVRTTEWIAANYPNGVDLAETIRTFVVDAYQYWGIKYLLLGGDTDQLPVRLGATNFFGGKDIPVDMYFGCLDGDWNADHDALFGEPGTTDLTDLYQEVYVGRLPATSSAVAMTLVGKVINYETPADMSYTGKVLLLGEVLFPIDWTPGQAVTQDGAGISEFLRMLALTDPSLTITRMYENHEPYPGSLPETAVAAIDSIEAGYDHVNHIGHGFRFNMSVGAGNIVNSDADALVNPNRFANLYLLNCTGVAYTYFCLAEHFLVNPSGGAVSVVGANESAYPLLSQPYMNEYYDLLFKRGVVNIGETFARSREPKTPVAQTGDNGDLWTHYIYCILADPEMPLWTRPVQPLIVNHTGGVGLGTTPITVTVADAGGPVAGARVCLSKGDDDYEVGFTDGTGSVTLKMTAESPGAVSVVASAPNRAVHVGTIPVIAGAGAYLSFAGNTVADDSTATTSGNGDGVIGAGEVIEITASVKNTGLSAAQNVTLALRTSYTGFVVEDSLAAVGGVPAGATVAAGDPFRVRIDDTLPDELPVAVHARDARERRCEVDGPLHPPGALAAAGVRRPAHRRFCHRRRRRCGRRRGELPALLPVEELRDRRRARAQRPVDGRGRRVRVHRQRGCLPGAAHDRRRRERRRVPPAREQCSFATHAQTRGHRCVRRGMDEALRAARPRATHHRAVRPEPGRRPPSDHLGRQRVDRRRRLPRAIVPVRRVGRTPWQRRTRSGTPLFSASGSNPPRATTSA